MKKLKIAVDMDGVLVDLCTYWLDLYYQKTNELVREEDLVDFDMFKQVKQPKVLNKILLSKHFFSNPKPYKDTLEYFPKLLKDERFEVFIVTQCPRDSERAMFEKRMWLRKYFVDFDQKNFISAHKKYMIDADFLLDDNDRHLEDFRNENKKSVCMSHCYNLNAVCDYRVENWKEFFELITKESDT